MRHLFTAPSDFTGSIRFWAAADKPDAKILLSVVQVIELILQIIAISNQ
jgi:hypothetical protein